MGQKVHPFVLRLGFIRNWHSRWYVKGTDFGRFILEDYQVRKLIKERTRQAAVSAIVIERLTQRIRIRILSARPGIIIGRHGADIERLREDINSLLHREVSIDIEEVKKPFLSAQLVAENVALQLERRIAFRRAVKRAIEQSINAGAAGVKICCAGRLNGAEMSRTETFKRGSIPLQTLRADIDYGFAESRTTYGIIGVKAWIYRGEILGRPTVSVKPQQEVRGANRQAKEGA